MLISPCELYIWNAGNVLLWKRFGNVDKEIQEILKKYGIEKVYIYHVLTDTDSTCLKFLFVNDPSSGVPKSKYTGITFEVMTASVVYNKFDSSHEYWERFSARKEDLKKV